MSVKPAARRVLPVWPCGLVRRVLGGITRRVSLGLRLRYVWFQYVSHQALPLGECHKKAGRLPGFLAMVDSLGACDG